MLICKRCENITRRSSKDLRTDYAGRNVVLNKEACDIIKEITKKGY